jgi:ribosomal protein S18 acetylase RimI-like enzyme
MAVSIDSLRAQDEEAFLGLTRAFYEHERFSFDPDASWRMVRHLQSNPQLGSVWLVWRDGLAIGYLVVTLCYSLEFGGSFALLDEIFVLPEARGAGLGKRLIDTAAGYCRERGIGYLRLEVQKKNTRSVEIYSTYGFRTEDRFLMSLPVSGTPPL